MTDESKSAPSSRIKNFGEFKALQAMVNSQEKRIIALEQAVKKLQPDTSSAKSILAGSGVR